MANVENNLEMRLLAVSDFDNGYPRDLTRRIRREKPDAILACGDFCYGAEIRKVMFANYTSDTEWYDAVGRKKAAQLMLESARRGNLVLQRLNSVGVLVFIVYGNHDKTGTESKRKGIWSMYKKDLFRSFVKQYDNVNDIDLGKVEFGGYTIIGYGKNNSAPEVPQYEVQRKDLTKRDLAGKKKTYHRYLSVLAELFKNEDPRRVIFISHNVPFRTKLDKITDITAPKVVQGRHFGSMVARKICKHYAPLLCVGGHMHEHQGIDRIGKTICVNDGPGAEGNYAIINIMNGKVRVRLK